MRETPTRAIPLDYASAKPECDDGSREPHFTFTMQLRSGRMCLLISILSALIATIALVQFGQDHITATVFIELLKKSVVSSLVGLAVGFVGLFRREGRRAAIAGVVVCILEALVVLGLLIFPSIVMSVFGR